MKNETLLNLINKKNFVDGLAPRICGCLSLSINNIEYEVWESKNPITDYCYNEYLKITFKGGAFLVRNVTGDSEGCILQEIAKFLYGGYYDEVQGYSQMVQSGKYTQIL